MTYFLAGLACGCIGAGACAYYALRRRDRLLGSFFAFASHEINTPITAINMTVLNFLSGVFGPVPDDQLKWLEMTRTQTSRLNCVVGELRDMIHLVLKKDLSIRTEPTSVTEAVENALQSLRNGISSSEVAFTVSVPAELPLVMADPDRLVRSVTSLIFHARKFKSGPAISVKAAASGPEVAISVSYDGLRLAAAEAAKSLEVFYPAYKRMDQMLSAVGVGLGVIREIARLQNGDLRLIVDSEGHATLTLLMPAARQ